MKWLLSIFSLGLTATSFGQIQAVVIPASASMSATNGVFISTSYSIINSSPNVDLSGANLVLASTVGSPQGINTSASAPLTLNSLTASNKTFFGVSGQWTVTKNLSFLEKGLVTKEGQITVDGTTFNKTLGTLIYAGSDDLNTNAAATSYVFGPLYVTGSTGARTFPVGNKDGYFPARLQGVSSADATIPLGLEVISNDPGFVKTPDLKEIFTDHFWEFSTAGNAPFSGNTQISLSDNTSGFFGIDGDATILEQSATGLQKDLFGSPNSPFYTSISPMSASGKYYALAKADQITVKIHKLITPNDDKENDVLIIDGLDAFPENQITIIDRWGVVVNTWKGFVNYTQPAGVEQSDYNFSRLAIGNYVCVVEYTERGARKSKKQMISVLK